MKKIELLAPAGSLEKAKIALLYGADAVYVGGKAFSLRARASNFTIEDINELCNFAHIHLKKVYITMNIIPHDGDFATLDEYLYELEKAKVDAVIVSSPYIIERVQKIVPNIECHLSTQISVTNSSSANYYQNKGLKRIVLARELSILEIEDIKNNTDVDLEVFIHGGMCSSYSGRCVLSNHMTNRDANRGGCAHSCRWNYYLSLENCKLPKRFFNIGSKDLMALTYVPRLIDIGIASLKIEGRMKSTYYIATVVRVYRRLIDLYYQNKVITSEEFDEFRKEIIKAENRETDIGFYNGLPQIEGQLYDNRDERPTKEYVGYVLEYDEKASVAIIEQRNYFSVGDTLEFFGPILDNTYFTVKDFYDADTNELLTVARHPLQRIKMVLPFKVSRHDMVRLLQDMK